MARGRLTTRFILVRSEIDPGLEAHVPRIALGVTERIGDTIVLFTKTSYRELLQGMRRRKGLVDGMKAKTADEKT